MKKFYLLCTAVMAMFATTAQADRVLYTENYESGLVPETWTVNGGTGSIGGDTEGKYFSFALGQVNGRSAHSLWGESIFDAVKEGLEEYTVSIEFQFQAFGNNQFNGELAIFSGEGCASKNGQGTEFAGDNKDVWSNYSVLSSNSLFDLIQNSATAESAQDVDHTHWFINNDTTNVFTPEAGIWYALTLTVNPTTREVSYLIEDFDGTVSLSGSKTLAEDASVYASGLYLMDARYQSVINVDNVTVSIPGEWANDPVIALTGLSESSRTYKVNFLAGETLHVINTDGTETTAGYYDGEEPGRYNVTVSQSGTLKAYTTVGDKTSNTIEQEVDCSPVVLPEASYTIIAASEGYGKTYQLTVDNKTVDLQPDIYMDVVFKSENGADDNTWENLTTGSSVEVLSKGTLTVTTKALGYAPGTLTIENDTEYEIKYDIDFQHMTGEELAEKGFAKMDDLNNAYTSGESNWTARLRLYFTIATGEKDEEGNDLVTYYPVYGFDMNGVQGKEGSPMTQDVIDGAKTNIGSGENANLTPTSLEVAQPIQRYQLDPAKQTEEVAHSIFAPVYTWATASDGSDISGAKINIGMGLINAASKAVTLGVDGLTDDEKIVTYSINDYGTGSIHPSFPVGTAPADAVAQYKEKHIATVTNVYDGTKTFSLAAINTALSRVVVLASKGSTSIQTVGLQQVSDKNAPVYNLNGVRISGALKKGVYIKQGKKFVVK